MEELVNLAQPGLIACLLSLFCIHIWNSDRVVIDLCTLTLGDEYYNYSSPLYITFRVYDKIHVESAW